MTRAFALLLARGATACEQRTSDAAPASHSPRSGVRSSGGG